MMLTLPLSPRFPLPLARQSSQVSRQSSPLAGNGLRLEQFPIDVHYPSDKLPQQIKSLERQPGAIWSQSALTSVNLSARHTTNAIGCVNAETKACDGPSITYRHPLGDITVATTTRHMHDEFGTVIDITLPRISLLDGAL
ncbi:hypothetical protein [Bartonella sp. LJL80]